MLLHFLIEDHMCCNVQTQRDWAESAVAIINTLVVLSTFIFMKEAKQQEKKQQKEAK